VVQGQRKRREITQIQHLKKAKDKQLKATAASFNEQKVPAWQE